MAMRPGRSARANAFPARKTSTAKSSEPLALSPSTFSPARVTSYLPSEIGFLAHYGVSFARLANAAETARAQGVTADRVLLAEGQISEDYFYRALARHLRLTFTDADIALNAGPYPQMIEAGAVALPPGRGAAFLVAPRGAAIGRLIAAMSRRGSGTNIALTTPSHLSWLVRKAARREIGCAASFGLPDFDANLCAKGGMNAQQGVALGVLGSIAAFFLPLAPAASVTIGAAFSASSFLRHFGCVFPLAPHPPNPVRHYRAR